jgi:aminoglycoside/choline kinase family phosphotransferase
MSSERENEINGFLQKHGWGEALQMPFAGDFSPRRYIRLTQPDGAKAILMDADPGQKTGCFVELAEYLHAIGIRVPKLFAEDGDHGLVLMEDLGKRNCGKLLDSNAIDAGDFYRRATDVLVELHAHFDKAKAAQLDLPVFGGALFAGQVEFFIDYYFPYAKKRDATPEEFRTFQAAWKEALRGIESLPQTLLLRDYMPDNLMDLPGEAAPALGVLDFQDAGHGPIAYDLASLCETVRRDSGADFADEMIAYYHQKAKPALSLADLQTACRVLSAQRHMRILGIIAKLVQSDASLENREKLAYMPRIWDTLHRLLDEPKLKPIREWVAAYMDGHEHR